MSLKRQLVKTIKIISKKFSKYSLFAWKKQINWLLRTLFLSRRRRDSVNAGFVLPTVAMVALVVVLLTTAILFRSFERAKNATNVRVNEAVLNASMPAVDRATAKLEQLLNDPSLPRSTPTDVALYDVIKSNTRYDFGDETRLKLAADFNGTTGIQASSTLENNETLTTAWKFPVDTDNNGKFDSFTLYAIYFRSPPRNTSNAFTRARKSLDARTPPMDKSQVGGACAEAIGTSASLVGDASWYKSGGNLAKSFFVYTANVPIDAVGGTTGLDATKYEKGNRGFSSLEYQQDRERIPVNNKAVWFENDLEISPGSDLLLNGSIHTNGNLLAGGQFSGVDIVFRQVSSKNSCYYEPENAKITIGGNLGTGNISQTANKEKISVHLFRGYKTNPWTGDQSSPTVRIKIAGDTDHKSTTENGGQRLGHNDAAYNKRINLMKETALSLCTSCATQTTLTGLKTAVQGVARYPQEVKSNVVTRIDQSTGLDVASAYGILGDELELYLRNRTRRVPFAEVSSAIPTDTQALGSYTASNVFSGIGEIEVPAAWREITTTNTGLTLSLNKLPATEPEQQKDEGKENYSGDRVLIGNNLPAYWKNTDGQYVTGQARQPVDGGTTKWDNPNTIARTRASQIQPQLNLGVTDRNDFWEQKAVEDNSANPLSNVGGLRVITGAGIYVDDDGVVASGTGSFPRSTRSFLPNPTLDANFVGSGGGRMPTPAGFKDAGTAQTNIVVWPDTMPMTGGTGETRKADLLMRATAVYHFKSSAGTAQTPIACVSSYFDPTNNITAQNLSTLTASWKYPLPADQSTTAGKSNNGIVYAFPSRTISSANLTILKRQARLVFPNGRIVNEPLRKAMEKYTSNSNTFTNFTMEEYSAVDTALCALSILNGATPATSPTLPHGAIREAAFLDAREVKALQNRTAYQTGTQGEYNLDLEQRQPLEIRVTEINLGRLASTTITGDYLLPKSGIIYATRDDSLPDLSYKTIESSASTDKALLFSQTDFKLDPTRRPNGIRLINGSNLARGGTNSTTYDPSEKGLILVSNTPVYVKGNFNLHQKPDGTVVEEFSDYSETDSSQFYNRATFNSHFACRPGRGACPSNVGDGDVWRPSTILADSITLLSGDFQDGFRNHGDYDLRDNASSIPDAQLVNNFVTSANWASSTGYPSSSFKTSYLTNGVTPIQRRTDFNEYLMEVCVKVPATTCGDGDWYIKPGTTGALKVSDITADGTVALDITNTHQAGTTAQPALAQYQGYARRVAFLRNSSNQLLDDTGAVIADATSASTKLPVPIGIDSNGKVQKYPYSTFSSTNKPRSVTNKSALWFRTTNRSAIPFNPTSNEYYAVDQPLFLKSRPFGTQQPQLVPVVQLYSPLGTPSNNLNQGLKTPGLQQEWVQKVTSDYTFNSSFVSGNSPSRPEEESAGLQNFVRFLEYWGDSGDAASPQRAAKIRGSFIQFKRSSYATAPFASITTADAIASSSATNNRSFFDFPYMKYWTNKGTPEGTTAYYTPPSRDWGFDVALLSQLPDLFAQRFTVPQAGPPAEYFREVGRDDEWVKILLCASQASSYAVPASYRPSCPSVPYP
ncbi:hormogonium polysaccharide biosynthesis protein HpsA [Nostoc sp. FACHB-280]|uniref:hormogonium polysaccharide biosynthesis protein HpsA n=1 Tax=Nostoc sp. FACHB-280 TaxID=2692839 RepID=UPI00168C044A|nr:hormogonium polysaccharide biosynthesis protein HpsA [Nostoc sp. FACHB-280]MBD2497622.1 hypothetical protein [Nostoc sp. FACHB-280]